MEKGGKSIIGGNLKMNYSKNETKGKKAPEFKKSDIN